MDEEKKVYAIRPNKTKIKREMLALRKLGKILMKMPTNHLQMMPISDVVKHEITKAKGFKKEALRRQLIFIEKLMRDEDAEAIENALLTITQPQQEDISAFHEIEEWRDKLIAGDNELLEDLLSRFENMERQYMRQLIRNANKELTQKKPPKSSRLLFQYLKEQQ